ncbi:MAG: hypothetical protein [crAssphage sp. isolate ctcc615]|uniref:Uncharacterized protein n=1 Tax=crAssphage sp. isolate ctcc615 TaxID=2989853 RepID=A0A345BP13_9CAUD|nr:MAG: hypothetical protein KNU00_gp14 [crAssphage sp. isolate ctcc615]AXF52184.1 MAG: hypothetical protein [crAssphage sp. isolate ctcc615]
MNTSLAVCFTIIIVVSVIAIYVDKILDNRSNKDLYINDIENDMEHIHYIINKINLKEDYKLPIKEIKEIKHITSKYFEQEDNNKDDSSAD